MAGILDGSENGGRTVGPDLEVKPPRLPLGCVDCVRRVCRATVHRIPVPDRKFSGNEPGSSGSPTVERHGGPQPAGEAEAGDVSKPNAPPDPRGMVKATLLQVQSRSGHVQPRRYADLTRRHRLPGVRLL